MIVNIDEEKMKSLFTLCEEDMREGGRDGGREEGKEAIGKQITELYITQFN